MARTRKDLRRLKTARDEARRLSRGIGQSDNRYSMNGRINRISSQNVAIADPSGGGTVDSEARAAIVSILDMLRARGWLEE